MYDVITIGGATLDIFLDIHEASQHCCIIDDRTGQWFCMRRGEKIPVDQLSYDVGGNAANVAVGLSRLGVKTATYIHYGSDEISQKIVNVLKREGVGTEYLVQDKDATSAIGIAINFQGERSLLVHHIVRNHALPQISTPKWLYLTSLGERWEDVYRQAVDFVKTNNVGLAFSPGSHQLDSGVDLFIEQTKTARTLFVNKEEAKKIAKSDSDDMKTILAQLQSIGPKIVSMTDGSNGSFSIDESGATYQLSAFPVTPLERTGAGDSYAAGFLAAIVHGLPVAEAMSWGAVNAASVISTIGAEKGLLHKEEIEKKLSENPDFKAAVL